MNRSNAKAMIVLVAVLTATFCWADGPANYWDSGEGTEESPYEIWTPLHLHQMHSRSGDYSKHFRLMADIDMDPALPGNITYSNAVIAPHDGSASSFAGTAFTGVFDGNGHMIRNLVITTNAAVSYDKLKGLFGQIGGTEAKVLRLGVVGAAIEGSGTIGALAGKNAGGTVDQCFSSGSAIAISYVGGLVGENSDSGWIKSSFSSCSVEAGASTYAAAGGLVGFNRDGTIANCYGSGPVSGGEMTGGLVGWNEGFSSGDLGHILNCYAVGSITGPEKYVGGFVGYSLGPEEQCFWDVDASGWDVSGSYDSALGLGTTDMQSLPTFTDAGWDYVVETVNGTNDAWGVPASGYPVLAWQDEAVPPTTTHEFKFELGSHATRAGGGLLTQVLLDGQGVVLPDLSIETGWVFTGWDGSYENVDGDRTVTAMYVPITGDGSLGNPYQISTREHLEGVNQRLDAHYVLINDIDLDPEVPGNQVYEAAVIAPHDGSASSRLPARHSRVSSTETAT